MRESSTNASYIPKELRSNDNPNPGKPKKLKWKSILLSGIVIIGLTCSCILITGSIRNSFYTRSQKAEVEKVIDLFMRAMMDKDIERAYGLFSKDAQGHVNPEDLAKTYFGQKYSLFKNYQSTSIPDLTISSPVFATGRFNQTTASAHGYISYLDGTTIKVEAALELEDEQWKLMHIFFGSSP